MSRMILVPIDISDKEFTERIISHVESEARIDDAEVHFLTVIPSLPYYASLGMAYTAELPGMDELREGSETQLKEIAKQFSIPEDRMHFPGQRLLRKEVIQYFSEEGIHIPKPTFVKLDKELNKKE